MSCGAFLSHDELLKCYLSTMLGCIRKYCIRKYCNLRVCLGKTAVSSVWSDVSLKEAFGCFMIALGCFLQSLNQRPWDCRQQPWREPTSPCEGDSCGREVLGNPWTMIVLRSLLQVWGYP